jgi:processive 1,2-diacylglycerol beta-glucosyltransferase
MTTLRDKDTGALIGTITAENLQFMIDQLVEESDDDRNYWLNGDTLEMFVANGADPALVELLRTAMGEREEMEVEWS